MSGGVKAAEERWGREKKEKIRVRIGFTGNAIGDDDSFERRREDGRGNRECVFAGAFL